MVNFLSRNEHGIFSICNILQHEKVLPYVDSSFVGYYNAYHLIDDFIKGLIICIACYSSDSLFPNGIVWGMLDKDGYFEGHIVFVDNDKIPLNLKLAYLEEAKNLIKENIPDCKGIVGYPPAEYKHVRRLMKKLGFNEVQTDVKFFSTLKQLDCVKVVFDF